MKEPKRYGRNFLAVNALVYCVLGLLFIINPAGMAGGLGFNDLDNNSLVEVSASFGGLWTAIGVYLFICLSNKNINTGLNVVFWTYAGFAFGRTVASIRFGGFYGLHCYWLAFELFWLLITFKYLKKNQKCEE